MAGPWRTVVGRRQFLGCGGNVWGSFCIVHLPFFLIESMSFLLALLRMVVLALLQSVGIFGIDGGLSSLRTSEAIIGRVVSVAGLFEVACLHVLARWWLFERIFRRVMRLICRLSGLLIGVCNFVCCGAVGG